MSHLYLNYHNFNICAFLNPLAVLYKLLIYTCEFSVINKNIFSLSLSYFLYLGAAVHMLPFDGSQSWWSTCPWNCSHVQDRQGQVWSHCSQLDAEVCHGMMADENSPASKSSCESMVLSSPSGKRMEILRMKSPYSSFTKNSIFGKELCCHLVNIYLKTLEIG